MGSYSQTMLQDMEHFRPFPKNTANLQADEPDRHRQQDVQRSSDAAAKDVEYRGSHHSIDGRVDSLDGREHRKVDAIIGVAIEASQDRFIG